MKTLSCASAVVLAVSLLSAKAAASPNNSPVTLAVYKAAHLAVTVTCQSTGSNGPTVSLTLRDVGPKPIAVMAADAFVLVDLTVADASGNLIPPESGRDGFTYSSGDHVLEPGQSLQLAKWTGPDTPRTPFLPIADWGFRHLASGTYTITAAATAPPVAALSSKCSITIK